MELLLAARLTGVPVRQHDYPCSVAIYHLYIPGPSPTASNFATVASLLSAALKEGLRRNETLVSVYLSNAVWPEIVSSADSDLPRFPSALLHKGLTSIRGVHLCFTFYLQISTKIKWSRGDSNP